MTSLDFDALAGQQAELIYEWFESNGLIPHVLVNLHIDGVEVPDVYYVNRLIRLDLSHQAVTELRFDQQAIRCTGYFNGQAVPLVLPYRSIEGFVTPQFPVRRLLLGLIPITALEAAEAIDACDAQPESQDLQPDTNVVDLTSTLQPPMTITSFLKANLDQT